MNFFKTSFWSAVSTVIKVLAGIVTNKILAIIVGPNGVALLGNFNNVLMSLSAFANGAIGSGVTKYISEYDNENEKRSVISHAFKISVVCSFFIGTIVIIFHKQISIITLNSKNYYSVFILVGITLIFFGLNTTITAVYNGYRYIRYLIIVGIIGSVLSVILAVLFTLRFGIYGALINTIIAQLCIFVINVKFIRKLKLFTLNQLTQSINYELLWRLLKFGIMGVVTSIVVPLSTLIIRNYILKSYSSNEAGYVQGVWNISAAYLLVITTTLSIYYLPTLSSIKGNVELRKEIFKGYKFILPFTLLSGLLIYLCRDIIIIILYTPEFLPMKKYFIFQIIGDVFKISSWLLGYLMIAKAMTKIYIISEITFSSLNVLLSLLFISIFGSIGVTYAYALNYFIFFIYLVVYFRKILFLQEMR